MFKTKENGRDYFLVNDEICEEILFKSGYSLAKTLGVNTSQVYYYAKTGKPLVDGVRYLIRKE